VVCQFRVMDGSVSRGDTVVMMNTGKEYTLDEIGVLAPSKVPVRAPGLAQLPAAPSPSPLPVAPRGTTASQSQCDSGTRTLQRPGFLVSGGTRWIRRSGVGVRRLWFAARETLGRLL
jgi:hypothetical protein